MVGYVCETCKKYFLKKYNYNYHVNRKYPCTIESANAENEKKFKCPYCKLSYTRQYNLDKHLACHEKEITFEILLKEMKEMREEMKLTNPSMMSNIMDNSTNNTVNNLSQVNNLNFQLASFGSENLSYLSDEVCKYILGRGFEAIPTLIKHVHFNIKNAQFHNCYTSNSRDRYSITFDGVKWNLVETIDVVNTLTDSSQSYLENRFEDLCDSLGDQAQKKFRNFLSKKDSEELAKRYKETIKLLLYNNREMVMQTRSLQEKQAREQELLRIQSHSVLLLENKK